MKGIKLTEFYPERQGRPDSKVALDMESRVPAVSYGYISTIINYLVEEAMKEELTEIVSKLAKILIELEQVKLHLAGMSDEPVSEEDANA